MIVREENDIFILTRQHEHARLSGEIALHFQHFFAEDARFKDCLFAIYEHDRSWIVPDAFPIWNQEKDRPYDFIDFPLREKLNYYRLGLDETEKMNAYAGLLCSMHYASFVTSDKDSVGQEFLISEQNRQARLRRELIITDERLLQKHFQLLQLCDNISLYLCLNRPGAKKSEEHPFFKKGFKNSSLFNPIKFENLIAHWLKEKEVEIIPLPFKKEFVVSVEQIHLSKEDIRKNGLKNAFLKSEIEPLQIKFISEGK